MTTSSPGFEPVPIRVLLPDGEQEVVGRLWLATQQRNWDRLNEEQQRRLGELGVRKASRARRTAAKAAAAFSRGRA
ncbi:hypothetical protein [Streptomyces sp. NBC_00233]|uniref:hypothetical protein n=1 Tax=Streptomyces sp. NBC_00233 TaxID=2975686 RepID=UPI002258CC1D|nr:hypothetical protein [Streptomyces sp. NBC_00233]MCX5233507.1 hypothetical protein [Streptomyces sp. NBC_00233]